MAIYDEKIHYVCFPTEPKKDSLLAITAKPRNWVEDKSSIIRALDKPSIRWIAKLIKKTD